MTQKTSTSDQLGAWALGGVAAFVAFVMLLAIGGFGFIGAAFFAGIVLLAVGGLISSIFLKPLPKPGEVGAPGPKSTTKPGGAASKSPAALTPNTPKPAAATPDAAPAAPKPAAAATPTEKPAEKPASPASDGAGKQPEALAAAREGGADNLKDIKGVGPKLEELLNELGIYHFDQIAAWGADEVAWMDENLKGFRGRVSRDDWVAQAKTLAGGQSG